MPSHKTGLRTLIAVAMSITPLTGCIYISQHTYEPLSVLVVDAESERPIRNAMIALRYMRPPGIVLNHPEDTSGFTGDDGKAVIQVANPKYGSFWEIGADGYLSHRGYTDTRTRIPEEFVGNGAVEAVITLYARPPPTLTVIIPDGYRGPLGIRVHPMNASEPGRRDFIFMASTVGLVEIDASPLLLRTSAIGRFAARYTDGQAIPRVSQLGVYKRSDEVIAIRSVANPPGGHIYVIGTVANQNAMKRSLSQYVDAYGAYSIFDAGDWETMFPR